MILFIFMTFLGLENNHFKFPNIQVFHDLILYILGYYLTFAMCSGEIMCSGEVMLLEMSREVALHKCIRITQS